MSSPADIPECDESCLFDDETLAAHALIEQPLVEAHAAPVLALPPAHVAPVTDQVESESSDLDLDSVEPIAFELAALELSLYSMIS